MANVSDLMEKNFLQASPDELLSKLIGKMASTKTDTALVFDEKNFLGIVSSRQIARKKIVNPTKIKVSSLVEKTASLEPGFEIEKILSLFVSGNSTVLPVFSSGSILGVVSVFSVLKEISSLPELKKIPVARLLEKADILGPNATVAQALALMRGTGASGITILDKKNRPTGFISQTDIVTRFFLFPKEKEGGSRFTRGTAPTGFSSEKESLTSTSVLNEMTQGLISIEPEESVSKAAKIMAENRISLLPVEENFAVKGVVSAKAVLNLLLQKPKAKNISIARMPEVDEIDRAKILASLDAAYEKASRIIAGEISLHVHFKDHGKKGQRKRHVVHLKLLVPGKTIVAKVIGWKLLTAVQEAAKTLEREATSFAKRS